MFATIFMILTLVVCIGGIFVYKQNVKTYPKDSGGFLVVSAVAAALFLIVFGLSCTTTIPNQHVGVQRVFKVVQSDKEYIPQGFHLKAPWVKVEDVDVSYSELNFLGKNAIESITSDPIAVTVPMTVTWSINKENVVFFKTRLNGYYEDRVDSIIRSSVRDTISQTSYKKGALNNRALLEAKIKADIVSKTTTFFKQQGFGERSSRMVHYGAINMRQVILPYKIIQANNDNAAADINLTLQDKLGLIEQKKIAIRDTQSKSFNRLVQIPAGMNARDYALVLEATANQMNVETVRDALENNKPITVVVGMGATPLVSPR